MKITLVLIISYFIGAIPMGAWVGKVLFKKDVTELGSKSTGTTNSYRVLGPLGGLIVLIGDLSKGAIPIILMRYVSPDTALEPWLVVAAGLIAIFGHTFSVFINFKGGKGAATTVGVLAVLLPKAMLAILILWISLVLITRYVSIASMVSAAMLPIFTIFWYRDNTAAITFSFLVAFLIIIKHRSNIKRLKSGTEPKVFSKKM